MKIRNIEAVVSRCSFKKVFLTFFSKFKGKHLRQDLFLNKVAGLRPTTLLKKRLWHRCFSVNFKKFLRTPFLTAHLQWLLLSHVAPACEYNLETFNKKILKQRLEIWAIFKTFVFDLGCYG